MLPNVIGDDRDSVKLNKMDIQVSLDLERIGYFLFYLIYEILLDFPTLSSLSELLFQQFLQKAH